MLHAGAETVIIPEGCSDQEGLLRAGGPKLISAVPNVYEVFSPQ